MLWLFKANIALVMYRASCGFCMVSDAYFYVLNGLGGWVSVLVSIDVECGDMQSNCFVYIMGVMWLDFEGVAGAKEERVLLGCRLNELKSVE